MNEPHYWMYEVSGRMKPVVLGYLEGKDLEPSQWSLLRAYLEQWVDAPVWMPSDSLERLRLDVRGLATRTQFDAWIELAMEIGMDPL